MHIWPLTLVQDNRNTENHLFVERRTKIQNIIWSRRRCTGYPGKVSILMEFCWLMGSVGGCVFVLDVTRGVEA